MLLHVIEAAGPIDLTGVPSRVEHAVDDMGHAVSLVHHVKYSRRPDAAGVKGLAAGGGIETRAIQIDRQGICAGWRGRSLKPAQIAVVVI